MVEKCQYRLSKIQKNQIAQNLIDILQKDANIIVQTRTFICNWILTGPEGKRKAFFDVWDIVLKNYIPTMRPILFRACGRMGTKSRIASFTGRLECARRFSEGSGYLLICDTKEKFQFEEEIYSVGEYKNSFYPLFYVLVKARDSGGWGFPERILKFIGEDEYIMRIDSNYIERCKWMKNDSSPGKLLRRISA